MDPAISPARREPYLRAVLKFWHNTLQNYFYMLSKDHFTPQFSRVANLRPILIDFLKDYYISFSSPLIATNSFLALSSPSFISPSQILA